MSKKFYSPLILLYIALLLLPYLIGDLSAGSDLVFNGFLLNPADGFSYLAKMEQGRAGAWKYQLAFSADDAQPHFLFEYYLFLGHLAGWLHIPSIVFFHIVRIVNALFLARVMIQFIKQFFQPGRISSGWVWAVTLFGSGMGWLIVGSGKTTSDLWVAEAYPFLSGFTNPHFPLSIALLLLGILSWRNARISIRMAGTSLCGVLLTIIQPFGAVILCLLAAGDWLINLKNRNQRKGGAMALILLASVSLPVMLLYLQDIHTDPQLASWNAQNVTPAPSWWDLMLSFSPALPLALFLLVRDIRNHDASRNLLWTWVIVGLSMCVLPISLQRRFLLGIYVPLTLLACQGLQILMDAGLRRCRNVYLVFALPTNLVLLGLCFFGIFSRSPEYFLTIDEVSGFRWLKENTPVTSVVLTDSKTGLFIPAYSHRRVIYGHPYETPFAAEKKKMVDNCIQDWTGQNCRKMLHAERVNYVLTIEPVQNTGNESDRGILRFISGQVRIYEFQP